MNASRVEEIRNILSKQVNDSHHMMNQEKEKIIKESLIGLIDRGLLVWKETLPKFTVNSDKSEITINQNGGLFLNDAEYIFKLEAELTALRAVAAECEMLAIITVEKSPRKWAEEAQTEFIDQCKKVGEALAAWREVKGG